MLRQRLVAALESPLSLVIVEGVPGAGKRTLLRDWAADDRDEHKVVVHLDSPVTGLQLTQLIWSALRHQTYLQLPPPPTSYEELEHVALSYASSKRRPIAVGISGADYLEEEAYAHLFSLVDVLPNVRLVVAVFDAQPLIETARTRSVAYSHIDDRDLAFTVTEVNELLIERGLIPHASAAQVLHAATKGHPGMVDAVIASHPNESQMGTVLPDQALAHFLTELRPERWPAPIADMVLTLVHVPRFSARAAAIILRTGDAVAALHRLQLIGLGTMTFHEETQQRVFQWHEPLRHSIQRFAQEFVDSDDALRDRVLAAARELDDHSLQVAVLVEAGRLAEAEAVCRDWLWDVLPDRLSPIWQGLSGLGASALSGYPGLLCIRQRITAFGSRLMTPTRARAIGQELLEQTPRDPWLRLQALARALEFMRHGESPQTADLVVQRAWELVADLLRDVDLERVEIGVISDLLCLAQGAFQLGNAAIASSFAEVALQLLQDDPGRLDPHGQRLAFSVRLVAYAHRERGYEEPFDAELYFVGRDHLQRDANIVVAHLAGMWDEIDFGHLDAADAHLRVAMERVSDPGHWPGLLFLRAAELSIVGNAEELRALIARFGPRAARTPQPKTSWLWDFGQAIAARTLSSTGIGPDFVLPFDWSYLSQSVGESPRLKHAVHLFDALQALRSEHLMEARVHLERAGMALRKRGFAPLTLSLATPEEISRLTELVRGTPFESLRLERALAYAAPSVASSVNLSEREAEVLRYLRRGMPNKEIAERMFVTVNTVKFHRANLMRKLGAGSRDEAIEAAARLGL
ncbi:MAG: LuxR C-terminal-related transcriptional regulator [Arachnia sp.]